ncbi:MAG: CPBP family intramembrane glutamic endopeptidase [Candidatus Acidiferrum sp.]
MTPDVLRRAEKVDLFVWPLRDATVVCLVVLLMRELGIAAAQVGIHGASWRVAVTWGVAAGLLHITLQGIIWVLNPSLRSFKVYSEASKGPLVVWSVIFLAAAFSQEMWLVFCFVALRGAGFPTATSILLTSIAFGAAHFTYRTGALAVAISGMVSCLLFLVTGSLLASVLFHYLGNLGSLYWIRQRAKQSLEC